MRVAISWSGGKDSCLALCEAIKNGCTPVILITMVDFRGYSRSNGIHISILQEQANSIGLPIFFKETEWNDYEKNLIYSLLYVTNIYNLKGCVFGDIDIIEHRIFEEKVCLASNLIAILPLWGLDREAVKESIITENIMCYISSVASRPEMLKTILGKPYELLDFNLMKRMGVDVCGENGEFHTVVYNAELIGLKVSIKQKHIHNLSNTILCEFLLE